MCRIHNQIKPTSRTGFAAPTPRACRCSVIAVALVVLVVNVFMHFLPQVAQYRPNKAHASLSLNAKLPYKSTTSAAAPKESVTDDERENDEAEQHDLPESQYFIYVNGITFWHSVALCYTASIHSIYSRVKLTSIPLFVLFHCWKSHPLV